MKRRKKAWIACAALMIIVVAGAVAFRLMRPEQPDSSSNAITESPFPRRLFPPLYDTKTIEQSQKSIEGLTYESWVFQKEPPDPEFEQRLFEEGRRAGVAERDLVYRSSTKPGPHMYFPFGDRDDGWTLSVFRGKFDVHKFFDGVGDSPGWTIIFERHRRAK